jgi:phosphodiesterase/alkaline phosphatase D-like protein
MSREEPNARVRVFQSAKRGTLLASRREGTVRGCPQEWIRGAHTATMALSTLLLLTLFLFVSASPASAFTAPVFTAKLGTEVNGTKDEEVGTNATEKDICTAVSGDVCREEGGEGAGPSEFADLGQVAVSEADGDFYVADAGNHRVQVWGVTNGASEYQVCTNSCQAGIEGTGAGEFADPEGIAVDNSSDNFTGDVYVSDRSNNRVEVFSPTGTYLTSFTGIGAPAEFSAPGALAVSSMTGTVYVADDRNEVVDEFIPQQNGQNESEYRYLRQITSSSIEEPTGVAVDSNGDVYIDNEDKEVLEFDSAGVFQKTLVAEASRARNLAVDTSTNNVYVKILNGSDASVIAVYSASGALLGEFGEEELSFHGTFGLALDAATGAIGVSDGQANDLVLFGPFSGSPEVTTGAASNIGETTAILGGVVNPHRESTSYFFEYGTTESYGTDVPIVPASAGSGSEPIGVTEDLVGLKPKTTYFYRLTASNGSGTTHGVGMRFFTAPPPSVTTEAAADVTTTSAVLSAQVNPLGTPTTYDFTYVPAVNCPGGMTSYASRTCPVSIVAGSPGSAGEGVAPLSVSAALSGLEPNTVYYYDIVATDGTSASGAAHEVTTLPLQPEANTLGTSEVDDVGAVLDATVNGRGANTTYRFDYGTSAGYGLSTPSVDAGATSSDRQVFTELVNLEPGATYHYRVVVTTAGGTTYGQDAVFTTTAPYPMAAVAATGSATGVSESGATVNGTIDPAGYETIYRFEYGTTVYYGAVASLAGGSAGSGTGSQTVSETLINLQPDTAYHYRLVASNAGGTTYGADETFITAPALVAPALAVQIATPAKATAAVTKKKTQTKVEKLKAALAKCKKLKGGKRKSCEKQARKKHPTKTEAKKSTKTGAHGKAGR